MTDFARWLAAIALLGIILRGLAALTEWADREEWR